MSLVECNEESIELVEDEGSFSKRLFSRRLEAPTGEYLYQERSGTTLRYCTESLRWS